MRGQPIFACSFLENEQSSSSKKSLEASLLFMFIACGVERFRLMVLMQV